MAKPKIPNQRKQNLEHKARIERYVALINQLYARLNNEAAKIAERTGHDDTSPFRWSDYPETKSALQKLQADYVKEMGAIVMSGTSNEWKESNIVQDLVAKKVLKAYTGTDKAGEEYKRYFESNPDALEAFRQRKENGMKLSDRVWNLSEQYKTELEDAISAAIEPGQSAMSLAVDIKQYLNEPDLMFRRFRYKDESGQWKKKWKRKITDEDGKTRFIDCDKGSYCNQWTGRGYYKSSAKNARRLARTEINMAYRTAEQARWEQFDFVVGYEVKTTQNGHHVTDICDDLKGKYPKSFKFTGWHPMCMCYCIPILKTEDEFWADDDVKSVNEVTDVPQGFKDWVGKNAERISAAEERGKLPYFIRDNRNDVENILRQKEAVDPFTLTNSATSHYGAAMKLGRSATKEAMKIVENIGAPELTEVQKQNICELADALGISRKEIKPMSFLDADQGASNPNDDTQNCQSCVVAFSARRRGLDCFAKVYDPKEEAFQLGERFQDGWLNSKTGKPIEPTILRGRNDEELIAKLKRNLSQSGEYVLGINGKNGEGHVVNIINSNGNIIIHDEQTRRGSDRYWSIDSLSGIEYLELLRIDKAILNVNLIKFVLIH